MKCKQGDLAEIIHSEYGVSIGKIVQCVSYDGDHFQYGPMWLVRAKDGLLWEGGSGSGISMTGHIPDDWLRPIKPPALPDKVLEKIQDLEDTL
jgi:hypothetical protein